ncbi:MAG TPA: hypothetical protein VNS88_09290 [Nitrospiraceae bacterium]|nr:hypothetical protein [Nitrospiraceae bacterium]
MTEYKSMTQGHLPALGIGVQIDPWTFAGFRLPIVSHLGAETANRNEIVHGTLLG